MTHDHDPAGPLVEAGARLRALLEELVINANRLCDRNLGGTYEDDCRQTIAKARALLSAPVVSGWQQRACEAIRKAIEDEDGLDGLEGEQLLREVGYYSKAAAPVVSPPHPQRVIATDTVTGVQRERLIAPAVGQNSAAGNQWGVVTQEGEEPCP